MVRIRVGFLVILITLMISMSDQASITPEKLNRTLASLLAYIEKVTPDLPTREESLKTLESVEASENNNTDVASLRSNLATIDSFYLRTKEFIRLPNNDQALVFFQKYIETKELHTNLETIYEKIIPRLANKFRGKVEELLEMFVNGITLEPSCSKYNSLREKYHDIYLHVVLSELKGLITLTYLRSLWIQNPDRISPLNMENKQHIKKVNDYLNEVQKTTQNIPAEFYRCNQSVIIPKTSQHLIALRLIYDHNWFAIGGRIN